jgi:hypothetical protein
MLTRDAISQTVVSISDKHYTDIPIKQQPFRQTVHPLPKLVVSTRGRQSIWSCATNQTTAHFALTVSFIWGVANISVTDSLVIRVWDHSRWTTRSAGHRTLIPAMPHSAKRATITSTSTFPLLSRPPAAVSPSPSPISKTSMGVQLGRVTRVFRSMSRLPGQVPTFRV